MLKIPVRGLRAGDKIAQMKQDFTLTMTPLSL